MDWSERRQALGSCLPVSHNRRLAVERISILWRRDSDLSCMCDSVK